MSIIASKPVQNERKKYVAKFFHRKALVAKHFSASVSFLPCFVESRAYSGKYL
jgi:hypothetical protein